MRSDQRYRAFALLFAFKEEIPGIYKEQGGFSAQSQVVYYFCFSGQTAQLILLSAAGLRFAGYVAGMEQGK
ncbi:MAG: hypothetical protein ACD_75C01964G0003 [uncultured bacterium]|nr:MAG: hypothetical protein ACD_75C01964G0003 [uncultured bacterium]HBG18627.1 hypothetical protein [Desulfobulbaceae bacterium]